MTMPNKVRTCLWFKDQAEEAMAFYVSLFADGTIEHEERMPDGQLLLAEFRVGGTPMMVLNMNPSYPFSEAASVSVMTEDQEETDRLWSALLEGGSEMACGWLKDRYGLAWQIVPRRMMELRTTGSPEARQRVHEAMMTMIKLDLGKLEAAHKGESA